MMHFEQQAEAAVVIEIRGREYRFLPLRYCDHAEAARALRRQRRDPLCVVRQLGESLDAAARESLLALAYRDLRRGDPVELPEVFRWYRTPEGALFRRWLMLRRSHPELSLAEVDTLLADANAEAQDEIRQATDQADGLPLAGSNVSGSVLATELALDWRRVFQTLSQRYGWTPREISELSLAQIVDYWQGSDTPPRADLANAVAAGRAAQAERAAWIEQTQRRLFDADA